MQLESRSKGKNSGCLYPRLSSIDRVCLLQHVQKLVIVAPVWETQPLVPIAPPTLCRFPSVISTTCRSAEQAGGKSPQTHLQLAGWLVSTANTQRQAFLQRLEHCSWLHGKTLQVPMGQLGKSGLAGVINNRSIHFSPFISSIRFPHKRIQFGQGI